MKIERKYLTFLSSAGFGDESLINAQNMDGATICADLDEYQVLLLPTHNKQPWTHGLDVKQRQQKVRGLDGSSQTRGTSPGRPHRVLKVRRGRE